ncbi:MAG: ABC transporter permease [Bacteroidia bacterium]|nr:ABC transporter permease [Bacteroidia bacterium]
MKTLRSFLSFLYALYQQKYVIGQLVKRDFQNKYLASYIGLPWAFIQPGATILVMWFAFTYGLKINVMDGGIPFVPWLICGLIPWFFISDTLTSSSNSLIEYSYLIKKTSFKVAIIPFIKIFTGLIIHLFFIGVIAILVMAYGFYPNIYWLQIFYLVIATFTLLTGIGWLISSINVFVRDVGPMVNVVISIMFWATPIIWPYSMLSGNMKYFALFNPFFYITEGYRYIFLQKTWIFQNIEMTIYFWVITAFVFVLGALVFKRLSPHFADVL